MACRMHIKHHAKGRYSVASHQHVREYSTLDETETIFYNALNACLLERSKPLPAIPTPRPANGEYPILDFEQAVRQDKRDKNSFLPWPSAPERGLYSRRDMERDLELIALYEASITHTIAHEHGSGIRSAHAYAQCETMRKNCKSALMRTVAILQAKDTEKDYAEKGRMTKRGVILTPQQQEHIRRLGTDRAYLMQQLTKLNTKKEEHNHEKVVGQTHSGD